MADNVQQTDTESAQQADSHRNPTRKTMKGEDTEKEDWKLKFPFTIKHLPLWQQIICISILSALILGTGFLSRVILHIMLWKLSPPLTNDRRLKLASIFGFLKADDGLITRDITCADSSCSNGLPLSWTCIDIGSQTCTLAEPVPTTGIGWFWAVMICVSAPYIYTFVINLYRWCVKVTPKINFKVIVVGLVRDTLHSAALCFLVLFVLPTMSPDMASLTVFFVASVPLALNIYIQKNHSSSSETNQVGSTEAESGSFPSKPWLKKYLPPIIAVVFFSLAFLFFIIAVARSTYETEELVIETLFFCILLSFEWVENFLLLILTPTQSEHDETEINKSKTRRKDGKCQNLLRLLVSQNEKELCILSFIKVFFLDIILFPLLYAFMMHWKSVGMRILLVPNGNETVHYHVHSKMDVHSSSTLAYGCSSSTPYIMMIICVISTFLFFLLTQYACHLQFKKSGFAVPILLNLLLTPVILAIVEWKNRSFIVGDCSVLQPLWSTDFDGDSADPWLLRFSWIFGYIAILIFSFNIFKEKENITENRKRNFSKPAYCGLYPDLSMLVSIKTHEKIILLVQRTVKEEKEDHDVEAETHM